MAQTWYTKIQPSPGKGLGIFTTENIARGTLIAIEHPVCILWEMEETLTEEDVQQGLSTLPQRQQDNFMSLAVGGTPPLTPLLRRFRANCFDYTLHPGASCICLHMSRFNHSCVPNAVWFLNENTGLFEVRTLQAIDVEKEVFICYMSDLNMSMTFEERGRGIQDGWGFACDCVACAPGEFRHCSDMRRRLHVELRRRIDASSISAEQRTWYCFLIANILIAEGSEDVQTASAWLEASDSLFYRLKIQLQAVRQEALPDLERTILAAVLANIKEWKINALDIVETLDPSLYSANFGQQQREEIEHLMF